MVPNAIKDAQAQIHIQILRRPPANVTITQPDDQSGVRRDLGNRMEVIINFPLGNFKKKMKMLIFEKTLAKTVSHKYSSQCFCQLGSRFIGMSGLEYCSEK